jgi:UDP-glucuronate 4-epimerase
MRELKLARLVFASSSSVYGARPGQSEAFREDDPCISPASPYAATKRMNELQLSTYRDLFGIGVFALRFFTVYGPRQRPEMAIAKFVAAIARGAPITLYGDGSSRRDYTFIDDIVSGTVAAIERIEAGRFEIYNLGGTSTVSLAELVGKIERIVGKQAIIDRQPDQPGDVPITYANVDRARAALGYEPTTRIDDGLARYWEWVQQQ